MEHLKLQENPKFFRTQIDTVFLNKFLDKKPKGFLLDEIDIDDSYLDTELELLTRMDEMDVVAKIIDISSNLY
uniref:Uncharacterized protein n=1 Tax=Solanum lycopersicum TaxID=4081 RepID=A0A3Q7EW22_SOLLC